jgi:hypothetical protein
LVNLPRAESSPVDALLRWVVNNGGETNMQSRTRGGALALLLALASEGGIAQVADVPILFVAQVPTSEDFGNAFATFGSHVSGLDAVYRGGDLMIRYPDGSLRNLTREAGFGSALEFQGANAIAVRDPDVHFSGTRAIFSMVVGAAPVRYQRDPWYWQMYEVTGLGQGNTVAITKVPNQPEDYNNVNPTYASGGTIIFASDRPRSGERHLYPQQDEYESAPTVSGLWKLDPIDGELQLLQHSPSGSFDPVVDSFGRVLFTRWDHLQVDQQAEADAEVEAGGGTGPFGTFDFSSEAEGATVVPRAPEVFPEPLTAVSGSGLSGHRFNFFFPWTVHQDGTEEETLNHLGRHELQGYFPRNFLADPDLADHNTARPRVNPNEIDSTHQLFEDPGQPGRYLAIDTPEFATHASGQLLRIVAPPSLNPDLVEVEYLTPRSTYETAGGADDTGRYRNPIVLANGAILAAHTPDTGEDEELGSATPGDPIIFQYDAAYDFRLRFVVDPEDDGTFVPGAPLIPDADRIVRTLEWWTPDEIGRYSGPLWELSPVEVRARPEPPVTSFVVKAPEQQVFAGAGVDIASFRDFMRERDLGLIVMRNVTRRDGNDEQQPYNLFVPGGVSSVTPEAQTPRPVEQMQFVQADQVRGLTNGGSQPEPGRRPLARFLHDPAAVAANPAGAGLAPGSQAVAADGSVALFVPSRRALSWQLLDDTGQPVVRERFWLTLQPGEIRTCDGCHGVNTLSHDGEPQAENPPQALAQLLEFWKQGNARLFADGFETDP